jgi:hypothetical protein
MARPDRLRDAPVMAYLGRDDLDRLDAVAEARDNSRSATARQLIREGLDGLTASAAPPEADDDA